jgi:methionyl-tRNA synthetase
LADTEPWKLIKEDETRVETILSISLELCEALSKIFAPFLPNTCLKLENILNISSGQVEAGHQINKAELMFQKIEDEAIIAQVDKLNATTINQSNPNAKPMKEEITFDDFTKMDIRVATITAAEKHPDADKLLKLSVDTGIDVRTIVSGIAEHYKPEDVIGKQVSVLINLAPRKIRGIESQGMILMAENNEGDLAFVSPEKVIDNGGEVR